jgi:hypothetical protein
MRRHFAVVLALLLLGGCTPSVPPSDLIIDLVPASSVTAAHLRLTGLSSRDIDDLRHVTWDEAAWQRLLRISVEATSETPVTGRYAVTDRSIEFRPAFPFDAGRAYLVRVDPAQLPTPRASAVLVTSVALPELDGGPLVEVTGIVPSADVWPENLLRFYIHFSGPMSRQPGVAYVRLIAEDGEAVRDALLASPVDFWSPDQQRYTVFFDPGRVKTGLVPNAELGRALVAGRRYTIVVDAAWRDAHGRPLREAYRRAFRAGPAIDRPIALADWGLSVPAAGSLDPLVVTVPWPLDRALFERTVGVAADGQPLDGRVEVGNDEKEWRFVPAEPWSSGSHEIEVLSVLEDPQGNLIDQAFEVDPTRAPVAPRPERYRIPFRPSTD